MPNEGWKFYECIFFMKNEPKNNEKFSIYGATGTICSGKIEAFFCCVWVENAARGP